MEKNIKKIDMHVHYFTGKYKLRKGRTVTKQEMLRQFDENNVVGALVMYTPLIDRPDADCLNKNKRLKLAIDKDKSRKYVPFAILNPLENKKEDLDELVNSYGFKGLKLISVAHDYSYNVKTCQDLVNAAEKLDIPVMLHSGWGMNASLDSIERIVLHFKNQPIIIAHMREDDTACPRGRHIELLKKYPNTYADTSYAMHTDRIKQIVDEGLVDRIFWADDFPWGGANVLWNSRRISDAPITDEEKEKIFYKNAEEFIKKYC